MRFDKDIFFVNETEGAYNPATGNYGEPVITETKKYASVSDTTTDTLALVYGGIKRGSLTIRLQTIYNGLFSYIRVDGKRYRVDNERRLRLKHTFVVSEV